MQFNFESLNLYKNNINKPITEVLLIYSSSLSYDKNSVYELLYQFNQEKIEINIITLDIPFELLNVSKIYK